MKPSKKSCIILALALVLILVGGILSNVINTDFGKVKTDRIYLVNDNGYTVSARIYIPENATAETPAPAMIICPGGDCPSDIETPWASELARRGYVVALVDYTGCGDTEVDAAAQYWTAYGAMELDTIYDFLADRAFVDSEQIGVGGHSMGSLYSYRLAMKRPVSLVVSDVLYSDSMPSHNFDFVQISGTHDEGLLARLENFEDIFSNAFLCELFGTDLIEEGKLYGSWEEQNARIFLTLNQTHEDDMYSKAIVTLINEYVMKSMDAPNPIEAGNTIYGWNYVAMAILIVGVVMMLFSVADILLDSSLFSSLKLASPAVQPGFAYKSKSWWIAALILTMIPVVFFFPGTAAGNKMASNSLFQLGTTPNGYMVWTLYAACGMLAFALIYHFCFGRKIGCKAAGYGIATSSNGKFSISYVITAAIFSLILFLLGYFVIMLLYRYADTDIHGLTVSFRPLYASRCATLPWYFIALLPYFTLVMIAGSALKIEGKTAKQVFLGAVIGLVGMAILFIFYEIVLRIDRPFYTGNFAHFYLDLLANVLPQFGVASALAIFIKKKTNSIIPGILIGVALVAYGMVSTNSIAMIIS